MIYEDEIFKNITARWIFGKKMEKVRHCMQHVFSTLMKEKLKPPKRARLEV